MSRRCPSISHPLFVGDLFIFGSSQLIQLKPSQSVFKPTTIDRDTALIKKKKSSIHFSKNTPQSIIIKIKSIFPFKISPPYTKYLGLPLARGGDTRKFFLNIVEKIQAKLQNCPHQNSC